MKILITNDDGIDSEITQSLFHSLREEHDTFLIAPSKDKSGQGAGTPADCVFMGIMAIMKDVPDIVISGINKGANMGDDVIHSGTLGAAFTARKLKYPPIALSIAGKSFEHSSAAINITKSILNYVRNNYSDEQHEGIVFNVNIPNLPLNEIKGISLTRLGNRGIPLAPEFKGSESNLFRDMTNHSKLKGELPDV